VGREATTAVSAAIVRRVAVVRNGRERGASAPLRTERMVQGGEVRAFEPWAHRRPGAILGRAPLRAVGAGGINARRTRRVTRDGSRL
jgi:hypothetical protein